MLIYDLKKIVRAKSFLFWNLVFPLVLMSCMYFAGGNIYNAENSIDTHSAVLVKEGEGDFQDNFEDLLVSLDTGSGNKIYDLTLAESEEEGKALLEKDHETLFVVSSDDISVYLSKDHTETAGVVAQSVADSYRQRYELIKEAFEEDPGKGMAVVENLTGEIHKEFAHPGENMFSSDPNPFIWYFYSTFVMGIFFNAMSGVNMVGALKADVTAEATRYSLSPAKKSRMIMSAFTARVIPAVIIAVIQLIFMNRVFKVSLGNSIPKLALFVIAGILFSIGFGVVCGLFFKGNVNTRANKATAVVMVSVFLSGEMINALPGVFEKYCPVINDINPATVLNMAFYKMAMCANDREFYINIVKIIIFAALFLVIGTIVLRREKYASV